MSQGSTPRPQPVVAFCERPPDGVRQIATQALSGFALRIPDDDARPAIEAAIRDSDVLIARKRPSEPGNWTVQNHRSWSRSEEIRFR